MSLKALTDNRALAWLSRRSSCLRRIALIGALVVFIGGLMLALQAVPDLLERINFTPLLILLVIGPPLVIAHSAAEFCLMARAAGKPIGFRTALEVTIYASALNTLPIPGGGAVTRLVALRAAGNALGRGSQSLVSFTLIWGGLAFGYAAGALAIQGTTSLAALFSIVALLLLGVAAYSFVRLQADRSLALIGVGMRIVALPLDAFRIMLAAWGVGAAVDFSQASVLVVASFVGLAVTVVPAGLGVREAFLALLAPAIGIAPAVGFILGVAHRVVWILGQAVVALAVLIAFREQPSQRDSS